MRLVWRLFLMLHASVYVCASAYMCVHACKCSQPTQTSLCAVCFTYLQCQDVQAQDAVQGHAAGQGPEGRCGHAGAATRNSRGSNTGSRHHCECCDSVWASCAAELWSVDQAYDAIACLCRQHTTCSSSTIFIHRPANKLAAKSKWSVPTVTGSCMLEAMLTCPQLQQHLADHRSQHV